MDDASRLKEQLEPLARALEAAARSAAEARLAEAQARVETMEKDADAKAARILSQAEAEGAAAAERESAHRLVAARRESRRQVLGAQRAAYDGLIDAALKSLLQVREGPEYAALQDRLAMTAASALGEDATVQRDPDGQGGVIAQLNGRSVDLTLPVLVRRCVSHMAKDVSRLWS